MFTMKITQACLAVILLALVAGVFAEDKSVASGADLVASASRSVADVGSSGTLHAAQPRGYSSSSSSSGRGYGKKNKKYKKKKYRPHSSSSGRYGGSSSSSSHIPKKYKKKHHSSSSSSSGK